MPGPLLRRTRVLTLGRRFALVTAAMLSVLSVSAADKKTAGDAVDKKTTRDSVDKKPSNKTNPDEAAIRATADEFVKAFNRGDAHAIAGLWTPNGSLVDEAGTLFKGRAAIEGQYQSLFKAHPGARMEAAITSIEFPASRMAIEDGVGRVVAKDAPPSASRYTAMHVRENGKWLMASVRETAMDVSSNSAHLQDLAWLVGKWETKADGNTVANRFHWIANKSFLQRDYAVHRDGALTSSGIQIIGWDPQAEQIRSWSFDSSGGYGTGLWSAAREGMQISSTGVLADGTPTESKELLIRVPGEDNVLGWRSFDRKVNQARLADTREVVLDRVPDKR